MASAEHFGHDQLKFQKIIEKCWEDDSFKQQLIAEPEEAIKQYFDYTINLPEGVKFKVFDLSDQSKSYLPLPAEPNWEELELTDEQLEMVAGGDFTLSVIVTYVATAATVAAATYIAGRIFG